MQPLQSPLGLPGAVGWGVGVSPPRPKRGDGIFCGPSSPDRVGRAGQGHGRFVLPRGDEMSSNPLRESGFGMRLCQRRGLIYSLVILIKRRTGRKKLDALPRKAREGRGRGHDRAGSRKNLLQTVYSLKSTSCWPAVSSRRNWDPGSTRVPRKMF